MDSSHANVGSHSHDPNPGRWIGDKIKRRNCERSCCEEAFVAMQGAERAGCRRRTGVEMIASLLSSAVRPTSHSRPPLRRIDRPFPSIDQSHRTARSPPSRRELCACASVCLSDLVSPTARCCHPSHEDWVRLESKETQKAEQRHASEPTVPSAATFACARTSVCPTDPMLPSPAVRTATPAERASSSRRSCTVWRGGKKSVSETSIPRNPTVKREDAVESSHLQATIMLQ